MISNRQIASVIVIIVGFVLLFWVIPAQTTTFGDDMGPALLPSVAAGLMVFLAVIDLVNSTVNTLRHRSSGAHVIEYDVAMRGPQFASLFMVAILLVLFAFALHPLGYPLAGLALLLALNFFLGARAYARITLLGICTVAVVYCGMKFGFGANLPTFPNFFSGGG